LELSKQASTFGRPQSSLALMLVQMAFDSWETIAARSLMIVSGTCSIAEYERMVTEKTTAALNSAVALGSGNVGSILRPWHSAARANAYRLRRR
jgi:hypothetical protein